MKGRDDIIRSILDSTPGVSSRSQDRAGSREVTLDVSIGNRKLSSFDEAVCFVLPWIDAPLRVPVSMLGYQPFCHPNFGSPGRATPEPPISASTSKWRQYRASFSPVCKAYHGSRVAMSRVESGCLSSWDAGP